MQNDFAETKCMIIFCLSFLKIVDLCQVNVLFENLINNTYWVLKLLFSCPVTSNSLWPHGLQHIRLPCPSPSPGVCPRFMFIASVMPVSHLIPWSPLLLPSISPSIKDFSIPRSVHIRWPKYWSVSFSTIRSSEYSGFISLMIDWFDPGVISRTTVWRQ